MEMRWRHVNPGSFARGVGPSILVMVAISCVAWASPPQAEANTVTQGWAGSVAGLAIDAVRNAKDPDTTWDEPLKSVDHVPPQAVPGLIEDARLFLEPDKLDQAEGLLDEVLKTEPWNQEGYWEVIQERKKNESRDTRLSRFRAILPANQSKTNPPVSVPNSEDDPSVLQTRSFCVNLTKLAQGLQQIEDFNSAASNGLHRTVGLTGKTNDALEVYLGLERFLASIGVNLSPPKGMYLNERKGMLMVRAARREIETMEQVIKMLSASPEQVSIETKTCELPEGGKFGHVLTEIGLVRHSDPAFGLSTGVLTEMQFHTLIKALEQHPGADLQTLANIRISSGKLEKIKLRPPNGRAGADAGGGRAYMVGAASDSEHIDVVPYVWADEYTIQMAVILSLKQFMGY